MASTRNPKFEGVYSAIEEGDLNRALKLLDKRDLEKMQLTKALKALIMERFRERETAMALALDVLRAKPTDAQVLHAIGTVFKRCGEVGYLVQAWDVACIEKPGDAELLRHLALAFLSIEAYDKFRETAMRLAKLCPADPRFAAWVALSYHALVSEQAPGTPARPAPQPITGGGRGWGISQPPPADARKLGIAEMLLTRAIDAAPPAARDSELLGLLIHTMARQGKARAAYDLVITGRLAVAPAAGAAAAVAADPLPSPWNGRIPFEERAPDEDVLDAADGSNGRGRSPAPFEPVDHLRYAAYLLVEARDWPAARAAFAALLSRVDAEDWAFLAGAAFCAAEDLVASVAGQLTGGAEDAAQRILALLAPLGSGEGGAVDLCGDAAVDAKLSSVLRDAQELGSLACDGAPAAPTRDLSPSRGSLLALLLAVATRAELCHRLQALPPAEADALPAPLRAALPALSASLAAQYVRLCAAFVAGVGHKACAFIDLRDALLPLLPATPAGLLPEVEAALAAGATPPGDEPSPAAASSSSAGFGLGGFLSPQPKLVAVPFDTPVLPAGCAAEGAVAAPLFSWTFAVPADAAAPLLGLLRRTRAADRPGPAMAEALLGLISEARTAAADRDAAAEAAAAAASAAAAAAAKQSKKGAAKKGAKAAAAAAAAAVESADTEALAAAESDPHGVAAALRPQTDLAPSPELERVAAASRSQIRRYCTAVQLLRYLGYLSTDAGLRELADEASDAWGHTLALAPLAIGGVREVQEGDDLPLLAAHAIWALAFRAAAAAAAAASGAAPVAPGQLEPPTTCDAARQLLAESLFLLEAAVAVSPHNAQLRLAAARASGWLGLSSGVMRHYPALRVKHQAIDSLAHPFITQVSRLHAPEGVASLGEALDRFRTGALGDLPDFVRMSVRSGVFSSALDMMRLRLRVRDSLASALSRAAVAHISLVASCRSLPDAVAHFQRTVLTGDVPPIFADLSGPAALLLRDNEDREVFSSWDPPGPAAVAERRFGISAVVGSAAAAALATTAAEPWELASVAAAGLTRAAAAADASLPTTAQWATGSTGGLFERLVRRASRLTAASVKHAASSVILFSASGAAAGSAEGLARLRKLLEGAGYAAALAAAPADASAAQPPPPQLIDLAAGALPFIDGGASEPRPSVRIACARLLWLSLDACNAVCGAPSAASASSAEAAAPDAGGPDASAARWGSVAASLSDLSACITALCGDMGRAMLVQPTEAGRPPVLRLESLAELELLSHHTLPHAVWALAAAARALAARITPPQAAKGAKAKAPAAPADEPARAAAEALRGVLSSAVGTLRVLSRAVTAAQDTLAAKGSSAGASAAHAAALGTMEAAKCVTGLVRGVWAGASAKAAAVAVADGGAKSAGAKKVAPPPLPAPADAAAGAAEAPAAASAAVAGGVGAAFVSALTASHAEVRSRAVAQAAAAMRAGYHASLLALGTDLSARIVALEGVKL